MKKSVAFRLKPMTAAVLLATASLSAVNAAHANGGGIGLGSDGVTPVQTFYANTYVQQGVNGGNDGSGRAIRGLRKFVDTLPGLTAGGANNLGQYLPVAVADTIAYANSAYYEIAVVEYTEKMHSDLAKATTLRGYVQIDPVATDSVINGVSTAMSAGSKGIALLNLDGTPVMISRPNGAGGFVQMAAYAFDKPHYLGPVIVAQRGQAVRIKYYNALPSGHAVTDINGNVARNGDLFLPVDETLIGSGYGPDGVTKYTQNRTALHWHGGDTPWISDGTPHQWIVPAADESALPAAYKRGASQANVSDMPDPGPGAETLYFPNNMSGRFMFYHDHALAITRLNVYAGMAAGYVLQDPVEQTLISGGTIGSTTVPAGTIPADMIPLVIQDKTFVPTDIAQQDMLWDAKHWGSEGDLWFPHVYETNQDPASPDGTNPVGRWDYGPWFWPVFPAPLQLPTGAYGDVSTTPEGFMDTAVVNGTAYPTMTVDPKAYRLRILNAGNDRMLNLGFYIADSSVTSADGRTNTEVKMVPFTGPNNPLTTVYTCPDGSAAGLNVDDVNAFGTVKKLGWTESGPNAAGNTLYPNSFPCAGGLLGTGWGGNDNRPGGVPDPMTAGPDMIRIATEGGILPNPVVISSTIANFEYNKRSITVLNVLERGLYLGNAERADVIVDFSPYAGKTLILYNDSPAPLPAGDPRIDYYTDNGDQTGAGGAPNTLAGFGPNTRTVMQFVVSNTTPAAAYNLGAPADPVAATPATGLFAALPAAYKASQDAPLIPESAYNNAFGTSNGDNYATIYNGSSIQPNFIYTPTTTTAQTLQSIALNGQGLGYTVAPNVVLSGAGLAAPVTIAPVAGVAGAQVAGGKVTSVLLDAATMTAIGAQLRSAPTVTFVSNKNASGIKVGGGATAQALTDQSASLPVKNKAIQELFDPSYGRMNATLGVELPFTSPLTQTTIPLGFIDPTTENLADGETQIWKITHNGVDTHPVHFHLVNLQVMNRVGWDGTIKPPADDEQGWKETIKMNPLEDIYVAVKPRSPMLPFGVADSTRLMDPSQPVGAITGFTQIDPNTGAAPIDPVTGLTVQITNQVKNYGWEYVWHCHILGHEENDFMRPINFAFGAVAPAAPGSLAASGFTANVASNVVLTWVDPTPASAVATAGNKQNEIGFKILRAPANSTTYTEVGTALANATTYTDRAPVSATGYNYQVVTYNAAGSASSVVKVGSATVPTAPAIPTRLAATVNSSSQVTVSFRDNSNNETSFVVYRATVTGAVVGAYSVVGSITRTGTASTGTGSTVNFVDSTVAGGTQYRYQVAASNNGTNSAYACTGTSCTSTSVPNYVSVTTPVVPNLTAPSNVSIQMTGTNSAVVSFNDLATSETRYVVQVSIDTGKTWGDGTNTTATSYVATLNRTASQTTGTGAPVSITINNNNLAMTSGRTYLFRVAAATSSTVGAWGNLATIDVSGMTVIAPASNVVATAGAGSASVTWTDNANNNASYRLQYSTNGGTTWANVGTGNNGVRTNSASLAGNSTSAAVNGLTAGTSYLFRLQAVSLGTNASSYAVSNAVVPTLPAPVAPTGLNANRGGSGNPITATLGWNAAQYATSYNVQWSTSQAVINANTGTVITNVTANPYTFNAPANVASGTTVYFKVQAVNTTGTSAWSSSTNSSVR